MSDPTMPPPAHDGTVFLWAIAAMVTIIVIAIGLYRFARRPRPETPVELDEAKLAELERQREIERQRARTAEARARSELEQAVKEGRALPDGRIACHATAKCMQPAMHLAPSIVRDTGFRDFVRSRFGAPNRYRMAAQKKVKKNADGVPLQDPNALYCDVHIHVARQVCLAQLAADEQAQQAHIMAREAALAAFEANGMLADVQRLVVAAEEQQALYSAQHRAELVASFRPPPSLPPTA